MTLRAEAMAAESPASSLPPLKLLPPVLPPPPLLTGAELPELEAAPPEVAPLELLAVAVLLPPPPPPPPPLPAELFPSLFMEDNCCWACCINRCTQLAFCESGLLLQETMARLPSSGVPNPIPLVSKLLVPLASVKLTPTATPTAAAAVTGLSGFCCGAAAPICPEANSERFKSPILPL